MSQDADAVQRFTEELTKLRRHAGWPSIEKITDICKTKTRQPAQGTIHNLLSGQGKKAPDWDVVSEVVQAMIEFAKGKGRDSDLDNAEKDIQWWRHRLTELEDALDQSTRDRISQKKRTLLELGKLVKVHKKSGTLPTLGDILNGNATDWPGFPGLISRAYVPRPDFDDDIRFALDAAVEPWPFILVYGNKRSGKSASAWRAVESHVDPATVLLVPRDGRSLAAIAQLNKLPKVVGAPILIWADALSPDDMNRLTREITKRLSEIGIIVGTISADGVDEILRADSRRDLSVARAVFIGAQKVHLPFHPATISEPEYEDVDPPAVGDISTMQIRFNIAGGVCPAALAIVRSAIDCRRVGLQPWIPDETLRRLFPYYLAEVKNIPPSDDLYEEGMKWASEAGGPRGNLISLMPVGARRQRSWGVSQDLVEIDADREIPDFCWAELIELSTPHECDTIGYYAGKNGAMAYAAEAHAKAATVPELAERATIMRALALHRLGDLGEARKIYESAYPRVAEAGESEKASLLAYELADIAKEEGNLSSAVTWWKRSAKHGGSRSLNAYFALGVYYAAEGDRGSAIQALDRDFTTAGEVISQEAMSLLNLLRSTDEGPVDLLARLDERDGHVNDNRSALTSLNRGVSLMASNDSDAAIEELQKASMTGSAEVRARAEFARGQMLENQGNLAGAKDAYLAVVSTRDPELEPAANLALFRISVASGTKDSVIEYLKAAHDSGHPLYSLEAAFYLGASYHWKGDFKSAAIMFRRVMTGRHPELWAKAGLHLGKVLQDDGKPQEAIEVWLEVDDSDDEEAAAMAFRLIAESGQNGGA